MFLSTTKKSPPQKIDAPIKRLTITGYCILIMIMLPVVVIMITVITISRFFSPPLNQHSAYPWGSSTDVMLLSIVERWNASTQRCFLLKLWFGSVCVSLCCVRDCDPVFDLWFRDLCFRSGANESWMRDSSWGDPTLLTGRWNSRTYKLFSVPHLFGVFLNK